MSAKIRAAHFQRIPVRIQSCFSISKMDHGPRPSGPPVKFPQESVPSMTRMVQYRVETNMTQAMR